MIQETLSRSTRHGRAYSQLSEIRQETSRQLQEPPSSLSYPTRDYPGQNTSTAMAVTKAGHKIASAVISLIICLLLFTFRHRLDDVGQPALLPFDGRDLPAHGLNITTSANAGNDAIPGWSLRLSAYLVTPFDPLDAKGKAVVIGKQMICMLDEDPTSTHIPQSSYTSVEDLAKIRYGWTYSRTPVADHGDDFFG